ncbi:helix-turn-helix transcriptional regulator [Solwaraspora sp. WMMD1047]|uniref:helix-turn-helix domain-containing protein n=1 Tax=Solwaraspora sp. WMMD1047 TaxID=3016102 RepID=UPI00241681A5|nr:helix-turn-helix transcriptional regulator [Solwaraspora sp. WMMD1047]MDG4828355.1 helix-turn-helix transcriptional regulator [Solwaraspora sp. WMMD1047]
MSSHVGGLGRILKFARAKSGLTQDQLAERMHVSTSLIAKFETNRLLPQPDTARRLDAVLEAGTLFQELTAEGRAFVGHPLWIRPWLELESNATMVRSFEPLIVPGLLQTPEYARAILTDGNTRLRNIDDAVAERLGRADILHRPEDECRLAAIVDEAVLRRPVGGPKVMADQLHAIARACALPNVGVAVVPSSVGAYPGVNGPLAIATVGGRNVAFMDGPLGGEVTEDPERVAALEEVWELIREYALPRTQSLELVMEVAESWS